MTQKQLKDCHVGLLLITVVVSLLLVVFRAQDFIVVPRLEIRFNQSHSFPLFNNTVSHVVPEQRFVLEKGCGLQNAIARNIVRGNHGDSFQPDCKSSSFIVYVCDHGACGGLGDRFKGIISMFVLALATNRTFVIRHTKPCALSETLAPNIYDWRRCHDYVSTIPESETTTIKFVDRDPAKSSLKLGTFTAKRVIFVQTNVNALVDWLKQDKTTQQVLPGLYNAGCHVNSEVLRMLFKPTQILSRDINALITKNSNRSLVCSHIRVGKNPTLPQDMKRKSINVSKILEFLDHYRNNNTHTIYTASDSVAVRNRILKRYPNAISTGRTIVHIDQYKATGSECSGLYSAVLELWMLSLCDVLVLTRSNFGAMAAHIRASSDNLFCYHVQNQSIVPCQYEKLTNFYGFL